MNPLVAIDESGNSGENLLDPNSPFFTLASLCVEPNDAADLHRSLFQIAPHQTKELHYAALRKTTKGQRVIEQFLNSPLLTGEKVKIAVADKAFVVTAKIVDLLVEERLHADGFNIYEADEHIALTNMLHQLTPVLCGQILFDEWQGAFVELVRRKDSAAIAPFYEKLKGLKNANSLPEFWRALSVLEHTRVQAQAICDDGNIGLRSLDPAIPCFVVLAEAWSRQFERAFDLLLDRSKPLQEAEPILRDMMRPGEPLQFLGTSARSIAMPLQATGLQFGDSHSHIELQLADLLAGAAKDWCHHQRGILSTSDLNNDLIQTIANSPLPSLIISYIAPAPPPE